MCWPRLSCPTCAAELDAARIESAAPLTCPGCARSWPAFVLGGEGATACHLGWDFRQLEARQRRFLSDYARVRSAEGRAPRDAQALSHLPWPEPGHPRAWEWWMRAASYEALLEWLGRTDGRSSRRLLDLGAGQGWLSHRLRLEGHRPVAVDLWDHPELGLGAARYLGAGAALGFPCLLADFDRLPIAAGQTDLVIYNASLHYSPDYRASLTEALRVLAPGGAILIIDSPVYRHRAAGERMVEQRRARYRERFGFASDALGSQEFLVASELSALGAELGLSWSWLSPRRGWSWRLHRLRRRLATGRASAELPLLVGRRAGEPARGPAERV